MSSPNQINRPTKEAVEQQERERDGTDGSQAEDVTSGSAVRRQPQKEDLDRRRRIEREEAELDAQTVVAKQVADVAPEVARSATELSDQVFAASDTEPSAPNTQPPTLASQAAVAREAARRAEAIDGAFRDEAVSDRMFSDDNADLTAKERVAKLTGRQRQYAQLMVLNCAKPLAQGIDGDTLTTTVTSAAIVWAMSPQFRKLINEYADPIHKALREYREDAKKKNSTVSLGSSPTKAASAKAMAEREDAKLLAGVKAVMEDTEGVPFSVDSAAHTLLQVHEDAYVAVRQGRDYDQVMGEMDEVVTELESVFTEQSLKPVEVRESARRMLGERAGTDPATLSQFIETANGRVRMTAHSSPRGPDGVVTAVWDGHWRVDRGGLLKSSGLPMFTVRPVMTVDEHIAAVRKLVSDDLASAVREGTHLGEVYEGKLLHALGGHHLAWDLRDTNLGVTGAAGASAQPVLAAAQRARSAYGAMVDDGLVPEVRHAVAGVGLEQGIEQFLQEHPEMAHVVEKYRSPEHQEIVGKIRANCLSTYPEQPLAPIVAEPANPLEAKRLELLGVDPGAPEAARDLGTKPVQECVLGPWGPRPSQEYLDKQLEAQLVAERSEVQAGTVRREAPGPQVAEPYGPDRTGSERRPVFGRTPQRGPAAGQDQAASPWTVVTAAQNLERKAKGMPEAKRVPAGMPAVPADTKELLREQDERTRLETAPSWTVVTSAQNLERERRGLPKVNRVPHGLPGVPTDAAALAREQKETARLEALAAKAEAARGARRNPVGAAAANADAGTAAATGGGGEGSVAGDAPGQGRSLQPGVPAASPTAPGAKNLPAGGRDAVAQRREEQAQVEQSKADRQIWSDEAKVTEKSRQQRSAETMRRLRNERNRRKLDPQHQPEL